MLYLSSVKMYLVGLHLIPVVCIIALSHYSHILYSFRYHSPSFKSCQFIFYLTCVNNLFNFLGTINHLHFILLFLCTSSRYHVIFQFFTFSLYLYEAMLMLTLPSCMLATLMSVLRSVWSICKSGSGIRNVYFLEQDHHK